MSLMSKLRRLADNQSGDTIIEVMVVLAVLGLSIGISYATANRSLLNARQAQEHSEASGLVETQVENLRLLAGNSTPDNTDPTTNIFSTTTNPFCILDPNAAAPIKPAASCNMGASGRYTVLIYNCSTLPAAPTPAASAACATITDPHTFAIQASWDDALGQGTDTVTTDYRLHSSVADVASDDGLGGAGSGILASLAIKGGTGPVGSGWIGNAYKSGDKVDITVSGVNSGDKCVIKNDKGDNSGTTLLTVTAGSDGKCTGKFGASRAGSGQTAYLTAYVTDSGNNYTSNPVSLQEWANTPTHYACSFKGDYHVYKGVSYSNWYATLNRDSCLSGDACYSPDGYCTTYMPTLKSYQDMDVACQTKTSPSYFVYGSTWTGGDNTGTPCPPNTTRVSLAPSAPPGVPGKDAWT